ncbi:hypothetical protein IAT38_004836 [Cryptococcus sp. DSM 104549]
MPFGYEYIPKFNEEDDSPEAAAMRSLRPREFGQGREQEEAGSDGDCEMNERGEEVQQEEGTSLPDPSTHPSDPNPSDTPALAHLTSQLASLCQTLTTLRRAKNTSDARLGEARRAIRALEARVEGGRIDPGVITLLACRLAEAGAGKAGGEGGDNVAASIAAALLDEVDRARACTPPNPFLPTPETPTPHSQSLRFDPLSPTLSSPAPGTSQEVIFETDPITAREGWAEARERRVWNLEGVVGVMCGRVERLEGEVERFKRDLAKGQGVEGMSSWAVDELEYEVEYYDDDNEGDDEGTEGEVKEAAGEEWEEGKEPLEIIEDVADRLNGRVEKLEKRVQVLRQQ